VEAHIMQEPFKAQMEKTAAEQKLAAYNLNSVEGQ